MCGEHNVNANMRKEACVEKTGEVFGYQGGDVRLPFKAPCMPISCFRFRDSFCNKMNSTLRPFTYRFFSIRFWLFSRSWTFYTRKATESAVWSSEWAHLLRKIPNEACYGRGAPLFFWGSSLEELYASPKHDSVRKKKVLPDEQSHVFSIQRKILQHKIGVPTILD